MQEHRHRKAAPSYSIFWKRSKNKTSIETKISRHHIKGLPTVPVALFSGPRWLLAKRYAHCSRPAASPWLIGVIGAALVSDTFIRSGEVMKVLRDVFCCILRAPFTLMYAVDLKLLAAVAVIALPAPLPLAVSVHGNRNNTAERWNMVHTWFSGKNLRFLKW